MYLTKLYNTYTLHNRNVPSSAIPALCTNQAKSRSTNAMLQAIAILLIDLMISSFSFAHDQSFVAMELRF